MEKTFLKVDFPELEKRYEYEVMHHGADFFGRFQKGDAVLIVDQHDVFSDKPIFDVKIGESEEIFQLTWPIHLPSDYSGGGWP